MCEAVAGCRLLATSNCFIYDRGVKRLQINKLRIPILEPVDMVIDAGECVSLNGPSGSGKSMLLRAIADLDPHEGEVYLEGKGANSMEAPQWRRQVALLAAESQWWGDLVAEHFLVSDPEGLEALGFPTDVMQWQVARLSTGEKQRLALLRIFCNRPQVLLLDEPTANLDAAAAHKVEQMIEYYRRSQDAAVLWVSHDPAQRTRVATRHYHIQNGRVEEQKA